MKRINMTGVKRWKVRDKESWEIIDRFFTYKEAEAFRQELEGASNSDNKTYVIVWD